MLRNFNLFVSSSFFFLFFLLYPSLLYLSFLFNRTARKSETDSRRFTVFYECGWCVYVEIEIYTDFNIFFLSFLIFYFI